MRLLPFALVALTACGLAADKKNVLLLAGRASHGPGEHEHNAGVQLLAKCLEQGAADRVAVKFHLNAEWPSPEELGKADTILIYCDGGGGHLALQGDHLQQLGKEMQRGCGFVCLHYAVEPAYEKEGWPAEEKVPPAGRSSKGKGSKEFLDWLGGYFEQHWSVNPHWTANFKEFPKHPISNGVKPFSTNDEWYYHMRFRPGMKGVTPVLSDLPPENTTKRGEGPHAGNPEQRKAVLELKEPQHVAWAVEREDGGRGFGFTGGHFHKGWGNDDQRKLVLNAIVWSAKAEVPAQGVDSKLTAEDLTANLDPKQPRKPAPAPVPPAPPAPPAK
jgi:hypothetical protein